MPNAASGFNACICLLSSPDRDHPLFKEDEINTIKSIYSQKITTLAKNSKLRQRVAATAIVYFKRFFLRNAIRDHDPRLIAPVALVRFASLRTAMYCTAAPNGSLELTRVSLSSISRSRISIWRQNPRSTHCPPKSSLPKCHRCTPATIHIHTPSHTFTTTSSR